MASDGLIVTDRIYFQGMSTPCAPHYAAPRPIWYGVSYLPPNERRTQRLYYETTADRAQNSGRPISDQPPGPDVTPVWFIDIRENEQEERRWLQAEGYRRPFSTAEHHCNFRCNPESYAQALTSIEEHINDFSYSRKYGEKAIVLVPTEALAELPEKYQR